MELFGRAGELLAPLLPGFHDLLQHLNKTGPAMLVLRRPIRAAIKRLQIWRQEYVQRPATLPGHGLNEGHVDFIDIGPFFAIDLDAHKMLVQIISHFLALEGFALHHVAPVAGRVADAQENRFVFAPGLGESLLSPRIPVHGIVLVLQQVGRFLARKAVGMRGRMSGSGGGHGFSGFSFDCIFRRGAQGCERQHQENLRPERHTSTIGQRCQPGKAQFRQGSLRNSCGPPNPRAITGSFASDFPQRRYDRIVINFSGFLHKCG